MIGSVAPRPRWLRGRFTSAGELHAVLDTVDLGTASEETARDLVAGYELARVHAIARRRQALARLDELAG